MNANEYTNKILNQYQLNALKTYGQNFLISDKALSAIKASIEPYAPASFLEIGPGIGILTHLLSEMGDVTCYEIDTRLEDCLNNEFKDKDVTIIFKDAMAIHLGEALKNLKTENPIVVSNLPYYITTPLIQKYCEEALSAKHGFFMVQKEVGERIMAHPHTRDYGAFSVRCQAYCEINKVCDCLKGAFNPQPEVDSMFIHFKRRSDVYKEITPLLEMTDICFHLKRKTLVNNLAGYKNLNKEHIISILKAINLKETARAEELNLNEFIRLYEAIQNGL